MKRLFLWGLLLAYGTSFADKGKGDQNHTPKPNVFQRVGGLLQSAANVTLDTFKRVATEIGAGIESHTDDAVQCDPETNKDDPNTKPFPPDNGIAFVWIGKDPTGQVPFSNATNATCLPVIFSERIYKGVICAEENKPEENLANLLSTFTPENCNLPPTHRWFTAIRVYNQLITLALPCKFQWDRRIKASSCTENASGGSVLFQLGRALAEQGKKQGNRNFPEIKGVPEFSADDTKYHLFDLKKGQTTDTDNLEPNRVYVFYNSTLKRNVYRLTNSKGRFSSEKAVLWNHSILDGAKIGGEDGTKYTLHEDGSWKKSDHDHEHLITGIPSKEKNGRVQPIYDNGEDSGS